MPVGGYRKKEKNIDFKQKLNRNFSYYSKKLQCGLSPDEINDLSEFIGFQQITVAV
jgi:hypothetical protein